jgi:hypothetical protein
MRNLATFAILFAACKSNGGSRDDHGATPPAAFAHVQVTADGKPLAVSAALIKRLPAGRAQVIVADYDVTCRQLLDNLFDSGHGHRLLLLDTSDRLAPDGTLATTVSDLSGVGVGNLAPGATAKLGALGATGTKVDVALDAADADHPTSVHGTLMADSCGDQAPDPSGAPKAPHPSTATITIAGKPLPLRGALVRGDNIFLSATPRACSPSTPWAEVMLDRVDDMWRVHGTYLDREYTNASAPDEPMAKVKVTLGAQGTSPDGPTVALQLAGAGRVEGYTVAIAGTIEAIECPKE